MPSINMIAPRRAEKRRVERDMRRLVVVIVVELVFAVALGGWVCTRLLTTRSRINDLDAQLAKLQPVVKQIADYETATKQLAPKMELLNQAKDRTMRWYNTLDRLTQSMPQSTYLTRLNTGKVDKDDTGIDVNINGISVSQARIGETMMRLHSVPDFNSVDLHYTQKATVGTATALEFEIGAQMKINNSTAAKGVKSDGASQS